MIEHPMQGALPRRGPKAVMMMELARKAWVVSIGHRYQNGRLVELRFFYVGHPTKQSAVDALRRNIGPRVNLRRVRAERELSMDEISRQSLGYRQVKYIAKGMAPDACDAERLVKGRGK
jgi:hypothetical protein